MKQALFYTTMAIFSLAHLSPTLAAAEAEELVPHLSRRGPKKGADQQEFDVARFVERIENGELSEQEIRENLNRQNPRRNLAIYQDRRHNAYNTNTPAIEAARFSRIQALEILIKCGANLESTNQNGETAIIVAAMKDEPETVNTLVAARANLNFRGRMGCTALISAASRGCLNTTQALIAAKADLDIQNNSGDSALIAAISDAYPPHPEIVKALLDAKANTGIANQHGKTAGVYASENPHQHYEEKAAILQMLIDAKAQVEEEIKNIEKKAWPKNNVEAYATFTYYAAPSQAHADLEQAETKEPNQRDSDPAVTSNSSNSLD